MQEEVIDALRELDLWKPNKFRVTKRPEQQASNVTPLRSVVTRITKTVPRPDFKELFGRRPDSVYWYRNADGTLRGYRVRFEREEGKAIYPLSLWRNARGNLEWRKENWPGKQTLYGLDELAEVQDMPVLVVEGEKAADRASRLFPDFIAVTYPGGANAVNSTDWSPLEGRDVTIWPDNDKPGRKAADDIAAILTKVAHSSVKRSKFFASNCARRSNGLTGKPAPTPRSRALALGHGVGDVSDSVEPSPADFVVCFFANFLPSEEWGDHITGCNFGNQILSVSAVFALLLPSGPGALTSIRLVDRRNAGRHLRAAPLWPVASRILTQAAPASRDDIRQLSAAAISASMPACS